MLEETLKGGIITTTINDFGVAIFFDYIDDETSTVEAAITDNFVETNHSVQDHIAIKPKIFRLRGCVGEVVYKGSSAWIEAINSKLSQNAILSKTINAMKPIAAVSGIVSNYTQLAKNVINQVESSYNRYRKMIDNFIGTKQFQNKRQQSVVAYLNQILQQRLPVKLERLKFEPEFKEGQYEKVYYLQSVSAHQGNNDFITDIEVTIKEFRIATTQVSTLDKNKWGGYTVSNVQKQVETNQGNATGQEVPKNTETQLMDSFKETAKNFTFKGVCKTTYLFIKNLVEKH